MIDVGVIGCGYWGPNLVRNFHQLPDCRLAMCCDLDSEKLTAIHNLYPMARTSTNYLDLLDSQIDAIAIATPPRTHYQIAKEALLHDKHTLVEKPLAMSSREVEELIHIAQQRHKVLMVGHTFEYNPAVWKIEELICSGEIGEIYYVYSNRVNLGRVQSDINALWSIAPHDISILLYLLETLPLEVSARGASYLNQDVEDVVFVTLTFPHNVIAHIQASWLDPSKVRQMTIVGSEKMIVYDDVASEGKVRIYDKGVYRKGENIYGEFQHKLHSGDIHIPKIDMSEPLRNECAHFIECIREGKRPRTDGKSGLRVVRVLEVADHSLRSGGSVVRL